MKFTRITDTSVFEDFYKGSALTIEGMYPDEAQLYVDYINERTPVLDGEAYLTTGKDMNEYYGWSDDLYPDNLNILILPLNLFTNVPALAFVRFDFGGRWFDDVVDNKNDKEVW